MKICLFQGTFNPIHNAHLRVADWVINNSNFDKIIFIPAYCPPHKSCDINLSHHRYNMVKLAINDKDKLEISDIEFKLEGKSYTYLTLLELQKMYNVEKFDFIIGTDAFRHIKTWYETDKLKKIVHFIIFLRDESFDKSEFDYLKDEGYDFDFQVLSYEDISSTEIRNKTKKGESIEKLVPNSVERYIKEHELYKS